MAGMSVAQLCASAAACIIYLYCAQEFAAFLKSLAALVSSCSPLEGVVGAPTPRTKPGPQGPGFIWSALHASAHSRECGDPDRSAALARLSCWMFLNSVRALWP